MSEFPNTKSRALARPITMRNRLLETCALENFSFRLPGLILSAHFYYKLVERGPYQINLHEHRHWEVARVACGSLHYKLMENRLGLRPKADQWLIIPPKTGHTWQVDKGPLVINSWQFKIDAEDSDGEAILSAIKRETIRKGHLMEVLPVEDQVDRALWEFSGSTYPVPVAGCLLSGFARVTATSLLTRLGAWSHASPGQLVSEAVDPGIRMSERIKLFLEANLQNNVSLEDLESHFNYSARHLNRVFHKQFGSSIGHYLRSRRMELSRRWLATTQRSIKDIALSLGYCNSSQFCRYFLHQFRMTPTEYRSQFLNEAAKSVAHATTRKIRKKVSDPFR